jgi:WD40 repeat protein
LIGTEKGYLSIYRLDNYTKIFDKKVSDNSITGLAFNNRSSLFALGTSAGDLLLWDYKLKVLKYDLSGSHNYITALKFSLDDKFLLSAGQSKIIEIWEITTGHKIKELRKHKSWVRNIAISPDGVNFASCGDDRKIFEWNIEDANRTEPEREIESYHRSWIMDIVYQDSADFLISVGHDNRICIHPLTPGVIKNFDRWKEQELRYKGKYFVNINQQYIQSVSISPGGFKLFIGTNNLGLFYTDYYQKFYEQTGSLLKAR